MLAPVELTVVIMLTLYQLERVIIHFPTTLGFNRITSNPKIKIRNMPPLQDTTVARKRQAVGSALPLTITPSMIWKTYPNANPKDLGCSSYPSGTMECQVTSFRKAAFSIR
jgi:hypothetical protein